MHKNMARFLKGKGEIMKIKLVVMSAAAFALAVGLASCGSQGQPASGSSAATSAPVETSAAVEPTSDLGETSPMVGMPNPWSEAASAEEAAQGAGLTDFSVPADVELTVGPVTEVSYRYMDGIAEATIMYPASQATIRKGIVPEGEDISGDYNEYANTWTQNIKGLEVTCSGNREGAATKTVWSVDGISYSINALGLGGDEDFGFSADDLNSLINAIQ